MNKHSVRAYHNQPQSLEFRDGYIWVTVQDGRILAVPLNRFSWLESATDNQRAQYKLYPFSILWPELGDGFSMEMLAGNHSIDIVSPERMAKMHAISPNTIYRILRKEIDVDDNDMRIPGAFFDGEGNRRTWYIPRDSAEHFVPDKRGRKPAK